MKTITFEEYLRDEHIKRNFKVLDDDLPDDYDTWESYLDIEDWIILGNSYGCYTALNVYLDIKRNK